MAHALGVTVSSGGVWGKAVFVCKSYILLFLTSIQNSLKEYLIKNQDINYRNQCFLLKILLEPPIKDFKNVEVEFKIKKGSKLAHYQNIDKVEGGFQNSRNTYFLQWHYCINFHLKTSVQLSANTQQRHALIKLAMNLVIWEDSTKFSPSTVYSTKHNAVCASESKGLWNYSDTQK